MSPQTWSLLTVVLCFTFLKVMKRWSRWSSKAEVQQWDMFPGLTEWLLIGWLTESTWTPKILIKYVDTKNRLADILTKCNFTRDDRPRDEFGATENVYVSDVGCSGSSWQRLSGWCKFYPKSTTTNDKQLFDVTKKLNTDQTEIQGVSMMDWHQRSWQRATLSADKKVQLSTGKVYVFSDSVLCVCKVNQNPMSAWKEKIDWFTNSLQCRELDRIDREWMEFEWKISQDSLHCRLSPRCTTWWVKYNVNWAIPRTDHHVNVQTRFIVWKEEMVRNSHVQAERWMGSCR